MSIFDGKGGDEALDGYVGRGMEIEGTIRFKELLRIDGKVKGKIITPKELVVGEGAVLEADLQVGRLSVAGHVIGKVEVRERVEIHRGGKISGELHLNGPRLIIEEGGELEGSVDMGGSEEEGRHSVDPLTDTEKLKGFRSRSEGS